jgi:hypothetical protein
MEDYREYTVIPALVELNKRGSSVSGSARDPMRTAQATLRLCARRWGGVYLALHRRSGRDLLAMHAWWQSAVDVLGTIPVRVNRLFTVTVRKNAGYGGTERNYPSTEEKRRIRLLSPASTGS